MSADARRLSVESNAVSLLADSDAVLASTSPNSISNVVAGVQPANFAVLNPLSLTRPSNARTASSRGRPAAAISTSILPSVSRSDFEPYLNEIASEWTRAQKRASLTSNGKAREDDFFPRRSLASSASSLVALPPLDAVPELFSDEAFDLANPRTFEAVTRGDLTNGDAADDTAADQILQEKLSHYLDTVESHLTREISLRSASFFSALSNLQSLHSQSAQALERIASLKQQLQALDTTTAQTGLCAVRAGLKRRPLESVTKGIDRIRELGKAVDQASQLADAGEWEGVLGLVEEVEGAIAEPSANAGPDALGISVKPNSSNGDTPESIQLHRLKALKGLPKRLARLRAQVAKSLEVEAVTVLTNDFEDAVLAYRRSEGPSPAWDPRLKELASTRASNRMRPIVRGLMRCGWSALEGIVASWKAALAKEIRQYVRADLPEERLDPDETLLDGDAPNAGVPKSTALGRSLAAMSHRDFMNMARKTMTRLAAAVEVASVHSSVLSELLNEVASTGQEDLKASLGMELGDVVHATGELANLRFSKVIGVRSDVHATLPLSEFVEVFNESWSFVVQCETACQRMIVGLRGVLVGQAKTFLQAFHQGRLSESAREIELEQWTPADVPPNVQAVVDDIVSGAVKDPKTFLLAPGDSTHAHSEMNGNSSNKHLVIEERKYFAVGAGHKTLLSLAEYIRIVLNLPLLATDAMSRIIEFLKQFNSRTCQVVLGAGAMRSAGLKNITAKNLALASQSLSIMIALIPYVREALRRHLSTKQATMLTEFDKLKRDDYQEHQNETHAKFVSIMNDRLAVHCKTLQGIDWATANDKAPQKYMESLVKETATLHKVLVRFLPTSSVDQITGRVLKDIYARLSEEFDQIVLHDVAAKARLLADAQYLRVEVAGLKGLTITLPGTLLEDLVQAKTTTIAPPKPPTPPREPSPPPPILVDEPEAETSVEISPKAIKTSPELSGAPSATDISRSASSTAMRNRLAGLFGKRSVSGGPGPPSPTLEAPPRFSADSASSTEKEKPRGSMLADRLAALTGSPSRSTESLPAAEADAVEEVLIAVPQEAVQEAIDIARGSFELPAATETAAEAKSEVLFEKPASRPADEPDIAPSLQLPEIVETSTAEPLNTASADRPIEDDAGVAETGAAHSPAADPLFEAEANEMAAKPSEVAKVEESTTVLADPPVGETTDGDDSFVSGMLRDDSLADETID